MLPDPVIMPEATNMDQGAWSSGVASGLLTLKLWCRFGPDLNLVPAGVCARCLPRSGYSSWSKIIRKSVFPMG